MTPWPCRAALSGLALLLTLCGTVSAATYTDSRDDQQYATFVSTGDTTNGKKLEWTGENLRYALTGSRCYGGRDRNCEQFGRLYSYDQADSVCNRDDGWHLPSDADWLSLERANGMGPADLAKSGYKEVRGKGIGDKLKDGPFRALPAGYSKGSKKRRYDALNDRTYWWSSTKEDDGKVIRRRVNWVRHATKYPDISTIGRFANPTGSFHISVRCVRDAPQ